VPKNESPNTRESKTFEQNFMQQALRIANSFLYDRTLFMNVVRATSIISLEWSLIQATWED